MALALHRQSAPQYFNPQQAAAESVLNGENFQETAGRQEERRHWGKVGDDLTVSLGTRRHRLGQATPSDSLERLLPVRPEAAASLVHLNNLQGFGKPPMPGAHPDQVNNKTTKMSAVGLVIFLSSSAGSLKTQGWEEIMPGGRHPASPRL